MCETTLNTVKALLVEDSADSACQSDVTLKDEGCVGPKQTPKGANCVFGGWVGHAPE